MTSTIDSPPSPEALERLVACHHDFLGFLEARLPDRQSAEEVLQSAFARTLEKGGQIRDEESAVAWFYRLLRNATADYYRGRATQERAVERLANEPVSVDEVHRALCACMRGLLPNLKDEYAEIIARVDLDEAPVEQVADELGITRGNATVRLHRARQALKRELERSCGTCTRHGCLDCTCSEAPSQSRHET